MQSALLPPTCKTEGEDIGDICKHGLYAEADVAAVGGDDCGGVELHTRVDGCDNWGEADGSEIVVLL